MDGPVSQIERIVIHASIGNYGRIWKRNHYKITTQYFPSWRWTV